MNIFVKAAAVAALASTAAVPASAQVNGIGVAEPAVVVASTQALSTGFQQIATTYQAQRTQLQQLEQQRQGLLRQLDTDGDGQLSQTELEAAQAENNPTRQQLATLDQTINQTQAPINLARAYVIEQIAQQLNPAVQQVVSQGNVQLILSPASVLYMGDQADVGDEIIAALNQRLPQVSTTPPENWQPQQGTVQLFQEVQQVLVAAAQQQAAAAQQQGQQAAPAAAETPVQGR